MSDVLNLNPNDTMSIPDIIDIVSYCNRYIVISPDTAKWLVLDKAIQVEVFRNLIGNTILQTLDKFSEAEDEVLTVVYRIKQMGFDILRSVSCTVDSSKHLHFYLTNNCNLRCPHCYMYAGQSYRDELNTDEIISFLKRFKDYGGEKVTFSGGEVTSRIDFISIIREAKALGFSIRILTNGTLWSDDMIGSVSPMIDSIQISIDGFDETSNAKIRGSNNFNKALSTIEKFYFLGNNVELALTPFYDKDLRGQIKYYAKFIRQLLNKFNNGKFKINIAKEIVKGRNVNLTREQLQEYKGLMNDLHSMIYGQDTLLLSFIKSFSGNKIMDNCMYGIYSIAANGDVYMCSRVPDISPIGNIREMSMEQISQYSKKAEKLSNVNNLRPCRSCNLKYICGGGCRIEFFPSLTSSKDIPGLMVGNIDERTCSRENKEYFYDLMVRSADYICSI